MGWMVVVIKLPFTLDADSVELMVGQTTVQVEESMQIRRKAKKQSSLMEDLRQWDITRKRESLFVDVSEEANANLPWVNWKKTASKIG